MSILPLIVLLAPSAEPPAPASERVERPDLALTAGPAQDVPEEAGGEAEASAEPAWTGSLNAGLTLTRGNSETTTIAVGFDAERKSEADLWTLKAWYNESEQEDPDTGDSETTAKNYGGQAQYDRFVNERLYWLVNGKGERDEIAGLQFRGTAGAGLGYVFQETERFVLKGEAGLSWIHEDLEGESPNEFLAGRLAYHADYAWTETTKIGQTGEWYPSLEDSDDWTAKVDSHVDVTMTEALFLRVQHVLDYDNTPAAGAKKADHRVLLTLGWSF